jgi:hypothetical protein
LLKTLAVLFGYGLAILIGRLIFPAIVNWSTCCQQRLAFLNSRVALGPDAFWVDVLGH